MSDPTGGGLRVRGLVVDYATQRAVDHVDLDVPTGKIVALLGPSGSGKSTILRAIAGLEPITSGSVRFGDEDVTRQPTHRRRFGLMFQDQALFPHRDVGGNVAFGLRRRGASRATIAERVDEMLRLTGLSGVERRRVDQLSGGEQQRVALARALAPSPRLLMLDEPLASLDRELRERLLVDLRAILTTIGTAVLVVTHDQDEALALADVVAVMRHGRIEQVSSPTKLWSRPANEFVARFLGFTNIFAIADDDPRRSPWGRIPATAVPFETSGQVAIRPDGGRIDAEGHIQGVVRTRQFRGLTTILEIEVQGVDQPFVAWVPGPVRQEPGEAIGWHIDDDAIIPLPAP